MKFGRLIHRTQWMNPDDSLIFPLAAHQQVKVYTNPAKYLNIGTKFSHLCSIQDEL